MASETDNNLAGSNLSHIYFFTNYAAEKSAGVNGNYGSTATTSSRRGSDDTTRTESNTSFTTTESAGLNPSAAAFMPSSNGTHSSSAPPDPAATQLYELRRTEERGCGLFATKLIERGTLIIFEKPLLKIDDATAVQQAWGPYCRLGKAEKLTYDNLHSWKPPHLDLEQVSRLCLIDPRDDSLDEEDIDEAVAEHVRVMSIFNINAFMISPGGAGVYATASRLNHSCVPNVVHFYDPNLKGITVHATKDIPASEEILATYVGGEDDRRLVRVDRREKLRYFYGFTCQCLACESTSQRKKRKEKLKREAERPLRSDEREQHENRFAADAASTSA